MHPRTSIPEAVRSVAAEQARVISVEQAKTQQDMLAAADYAARVAGGNGKLGAVGFCWGGGIVNYLATQRATLGAGVPFYGIAPPVAVPHSAWSWFANLLNYGLVGGFMLGEYQYRKRRFPRRPYRNGLDFARRMAALGPAFWRDLLR